MQVYQKSIGTLSDAKFLKVPFDPQLFLLFVSPTFDDTDGFLQQLNEAYPNASFFGCSTAGEILGNHVQDSTVAFTAIRFDKTTFRQVEVSLDEVQSNSCSAGKVVLQRLEDENLRHILILSDGLNVNGAELVKGLHEDLPKGVHVTGGLAGDGPDFKDTFIISGPRRSSRKIVALGLYGSDLNIGFGSKGGWDSFGIERLVTRSEDNILYELDGQPALELYKSFLGEKAKDLPGSGLLFPLSMRQHQDAAPVVRTILAVNEEDQSLTFAGNIPENSYVRLMKANVDRIINGAEQSAMITRNGSEVDTQLAILISCVGRRLVMKQLVEEEVEAVNEVLGSQVHSTGFYSYGEIAPFDQFSPCELHNQTMTITTLSE